MKALRRNGLLIVSVTCSVLLGAAIWWRSGHSSVQAVAIQEGGGGYAPLTAVQRDAVLKILNDLNLDREALAALNLTSLQAESLLSTTRTWQANNSATLAAKKAAIDEDTAAVRSLQMAIALGPAQAGQEASLATAVQELVTSKADYLTALNPLKADLEALLSVSQRGTWTAIKSGHGQALPPRMLALTDGQRLDLGKEWHEFRCEVGGATDANARSSAATEWNTDRDTVLTAEQETVVASFHTNFAPASQVVTDAVTLVLPLAS